MPLEFLMATAVALAKWSFIGLVFGYFYPALGGRDGLSKGLRFFAALVGPLAVQQALSSPQPGPEWKGFVLMVAQLLIHTLLLGLIANDYAVIRRYGYGWRNLLEVHNMGALTAYVSTLVVAIGTAVTTLVSAQATVVAKSAFEQWTTPASQEQLRVQTRDDPAVQSAEASTSGGQQPGAGGARAGGGQRTNH
jgi:hypothetical protein